MPKSAKKRKDKAADFAKAKLKLGKGKQTPSNALDTSFKARSITLPSQRITTANLADEPTTRRKLTFQDLISHSKHYSAGTRRDALHGFKELFEDHPELIESHLANLVAATCRLIGDEDAGVRKALHVFYAWFLPQVFPEQLAPHAPILLLFTTSAQTHIFPEVRLDAIRFLNILLDHIPEAIVTGCEQEGSGHGRRILEGYLGILNAGTALHDAEGPLQATSMASVVLKPTSKLVVLESLSTFLNQAMSNHSDMSRQSEHPSTTFLDTWYLASSFPSADAYQAFEQLLQPSYVLSRSNLRKWTAEIGAEEEDFRSFHILAEPSKTGLSDAIAGAVHLAACEWTTDKSDVFLLRLTQALHPILITTFLDIAPSVFNPHVKPAEADVKLVLVVAHLARRLYSNIFRDSLPGVCGSDEACHNLHVLLGYMAAYFPFHNTGLRDTQVEEALMDLSVVYCELMSLLLAKGTTSAVDYFPLKRQQPRARANLTAQAEAVCEYVTQVLHGEATLETQPGRSLSYRAYLSLLPTIWMFLNVASASQSGHANSILNATLQHAINLPSKSMLKRPSVEFIARLSMLETERSYCGKFTLVREGAELERWTEWVYHLPQTLWELGSSNLPATEVILRFLLRILQRTSRLMGPATISELRRRLAPFFSIEHPVRGRLIGPYNKLPAGSTLRRLAIDVASTILSSGDEANWTLLREAVNIAVEGTEERSYWEQLYK